jgi:RHH-type transcriptional regulator, rel operon repressor / antitoxin RelB
MLALRLPPDIEARLDKLARLTGRTKSFYAREAIEEHLADLEDAYLAEQRLRDDPQFVDFDEAMRELGVDLDAASPLKTG